MEHGLTLVKGKNRSDIALAVKVCDIKIQRLACVVGHFRNCCLAHHGLLDRFSCGEVQHPQGDVDVFSLSCHQSLRNGLIVVLIPIGHSASMIVGIHGLFVLSEHGVP